MKDLKMLKEEKTFYDYAPIALERFHNAGMPVVVGAIFESPFEVLCGGRSLMAFLMDDLMEMDEDEINEIFALIHKKNMEDYEAFLKSPQSLSVFGSAAGEELLQCSTERCSLTIHGST